VLGIVLLIAERVGAHRKTVDELHERDGLAFGLAQSMALVPGVSRSGATITAGLFLGYTRADAARFSFLLSIPAVVLSGLFELRKLGDDTMPSASATVIATIVSFLVGYASIAWLLRWLGGHSTMVFVIYRLALGALVLALVAAGAIDAKP
jgi:undecaprenyl-diphosphatase